MSSIADSISKSMRRTTSSILSPTEASTSTSASSLMDSTSSSGNMGNMSNNNWIDISAYTWKGWMLIILVLAILGINIFAILGRGADEATSIFGPIINKITGLFIGTTSQIIGTSASGAKTVIDSTTDVADKTLSKIASITPVSGSGSGSSSSGSSSGSTISPPNPARRSPIAPPPEPQGSIGMPPDHGPVHGPGFCYVGSGDPFRTCAQVGYDDLCMSGEVFPTHDQCVNPAMR